MVYVLLELGRSAEAKSEEQEKREREESGEGSHPEISEKAFPEERRLFFGLCRVEIEEESTESKFKEKTYVEERKAEKARREKRGACEEIADLVVGGEFEVHESEAETKAATPVTRRFLELC